MTKPRPKRARHEKDIPPSLSSKQGKSSDVPSRFRLITKMMADIQVRKQDKKVAKSKGLPAPKLHSCESVPPTHRNKNASPLIPHVTGKLLQRDAKKSTNAAPKDRSTRPATKRHSAPSEMTSKSQTSEKADITSSAKRRQRRIATQDEPPVEPPVLTKRDFDQLEDSVTFGDVAMAPPSLKIFNKMKKRRVQNILAQHVTYSAVQKTMVNTPAQQRLLDDERTRVIQLYRDLKSKRELDVLFKQHVE